MGILIRKLKSSKKKSNQLRPIEMLNRPNHIFRQHFNGKPQEVYHINCGGGEKNIVTIWWDDESKNYGLSTDSKESLKEYCDTVSVVDVTDEVTISIDIQS